MPREHLSDKPSLRESRRCVIEGATHLNFAGIGMSWKTENLVMKEVLPFLDSLRNGNCGIVVSAGEIAVEQN